MSSQNYWAVTVKYVYGKASDVKPMDYAHFMRHCNDIHKSLEFLETTFEKDSCNRLHMHAIATGPKRLYTKKLQKHGFNIDFQLLETQEAIDSWFNYIQKDNFKEYQMAS